MSKEVLVVDDLPQFRSLYSKVLSEAGFVVTEAAGAQEALSLIPKHRFVMVVSDVRMPGMDGIQLLQETRRLGSEVPFLLVTAFPDVRQAVAALKLGAVDYLQKPVDLDELLMAVSEAAGTPWILEEAGVPRHLMDGIVAESRSMQLVFQDAYRIAASDANVLLSGESGTGKEVLASFIHAASTRAKHTMVALNCAAIPQQLLASELFGHEKGAFTGADHRRIGRFREADGGTLFLDEIGDLPLDLQAALLRSIESRKVTPVGSDKEVHVDFRLVVATNKNLEEAVERGEFRLDLYYRLNVVAFTIPPLRERPEEILPLASAILTGRPGEKRRLSRSAARCLLNHPWPGNIRELKNALERAALLSRTEVILPEHLPPAMRTCSPLQDNAEDDQPWQQTASAATDQGATLESMEIEAIRQALRATGGNRTKAADILGITRRGLLYKLKRFGIDDK